MIKPIDELVEDRVRAIERDFKELRGVCIEITYGYKVEKNINAFYITPQEIIDCVALICNIDVELIQSKKRGQNEVCNARFICIAEISKYHPKMTLLEIGKHFSGRDHTTIINSKNVYEDYCQFEPSFKDLAERCALYIAKEIEAKKY